MTVHSFSTQYNTQFW